MASLCSAAVAATAGSNFGTLFCSTMPTTELTTSVSCEVASSTRSAACCAFRAFSYRPLGACSAFRASGLHCCLVVQKPSFAHLLSSWGCGCSMVGRLSHTISQVKRSYLNKKSPMSGYRSVPPQEHSVWEVTWPWAWVAPEPEIKTASSWTSATAVELSNVPASPWQPDTLLISFALGSTVALLCSSAGAAAGGAAAGAAAGAPPAVALVAFPVANIVAAFLSDRSAASTISSSLQTEPDNADTCTVTALRASAAGIAMVADSVASVVACCTPASLTWTIFWSAVGLQVGGFPQDPSLTQTLTSSGYGFSTHGAVDHVKAQVHKSYVHANCVPSWKSNLPLQVQSVEWTIFPSEWETEPPWAM
mmetsp:Transcript_54355/g.119230  ORF Transcript_54355/g.119230 Transcript_54355/m.119230 type:complete len:364 (-) Transcript_54355:274-1365(-)